MLNQGTVVLYLGIKLQKEFVSLKFGAVRVCDTADKTFEQLCF